MKRFSIKILFMIAAAGLGGFGIWWAVVQLSQQPSVIQKSYPLSQFVQQKA